MVNWDNIEKASDLLDKHGITMFISIVTIVMVMKAIPKLIDAMIKKLDLVVDKIEKLSKTIDRNQKSGNEVAHTDREHQTNKIVEVVKENQNFYLTHTTEFQRTILADKNNTIDLFKEENKQLRKEKDSLYERLIDKGFKDAPQELNTIESS